MLSPSPMVPAISWLVRFGAEQSLFTLDQTKSVHAALGEDTDLLSFAQQLIDDGHVDDSSLGDLEKIAREAMAKAREGAPEGDPFTPAPA